MKRFTHGIMVVDPLNPDDIGSDKTAVIHFVGYWSEPADWDVEANRLREEFRNDPEFGLQDIADRLVMYPATPDCLNYYNDMDEIDGILHDFPKEKLN